MTVEVAAWTWWCGRGGVVVATLISDNHLPESMRVNIRALWPLLLALTLWHTPPAETVFSMDQMGSEVSMKVGRMVGQVVEQHLAQCHLVLITTTQHSPVFTHILR